MARSKKRTISPEGFAKANDWASKSKRWNKADAALNGIRSDTYDAGMRYVGGVGGKEAPFIPDEQYRSLLPAGMNPDDYKKRASIAERTTYETTGRDASTVSPHVVEGYKNDALRARDAGDYESARKLAEAAKYFSAARDTWGGRGASSPRPSKGGGSYGGGKGSTQPYSGSAGRSKPTGKPKGGDGWKDPVEHNPLKRYASMVLGNSGVQLALKSMRMPYSYVASHISDVATSLDKGDIGGALEGIAKTTPALGTSIQGIQELNDAVHGRKIDLGKVLNPYKNEQSRKDFWAQTGTGEYLQRGLDKHHWDDGTPLNNKWVKRTIGLGGDIGMDPLTYLTAGTEKLAGSSAQVATRFLESGEGLAAREAAKVAAEGGSEALQKKAAAEAIQWTKERAAAITSKGKHVLSSEDIARAFPEEKVAGGLAFRAPFTGRPTRSLVKGLTGKEIEEKLIPLLPKNVTNPLQRGLSKPIRALTASGLAEKASGKFAGEFGQEIRSMVRSGDPNEVYTGLGVKRGMNMLRSKAAAGVHVSADTIRELFPEHADKLIKAAGTEAEVGSGLPRIWMKIVAPAIHGHEAEVMKAVEAGTPDAVKGGREVANFYAAAHRALKEAGVPVGEIPDGQYIPRMFTAEGKQALLEASQDVPKGTTAVDPKAPFMKHRATLEELGVHNQAEARALLETLYGKGTFETDLHKIAANYMRHADQQLGRKAMLDELVGWGIAHPTDNPESIDQLVKSVVSRSGGRPIPNEPMPADLMDVSSMGDDPFIPAGDEAAYQYMNSAFNGHVEQPFEPPVPESPAERRAYQAAEERRIADAVERVNAARLERRARPFRGEPRAGFEPDPSLPYDPSRFQTSGAVPDQFAGTATMGRRSFDNVDPTRTAWAEAALSPNPTNEDLSRLAEAAKAEASQAAVGALTGESVGNVAGRTYERAVATRLQHMINDVVTKHVDLSTGEVNAAQAPMDHLLTEIAASPHSEAMYRQLERLGAAERRAIAWEENPSDLLSPREELASMNWDDAKAYDAEGDVSHNAVKLGKKHTPMDLTNIKNPQELQREIDKIDNQILDLENELQSAPWVERGELLDHITKLRNWRDRADRALWNETGTAVETSVSNSRASSLKAMELGQTQPPPAPWRGELLGSKDIFGKETGLSRSAYDAAALGKQKNLSDAYLGLQRLLSEHAGTELGVGQEQIQMLDQLSPVANTLYQVRTELGGTAFSIPSKEEISAAHAAMGLNPKPLHEIAADLMGPQSKAFFEDTMSKLNELKQSINGMEHTPEAEQAMREVQRQQSRLWLAAASGKDSEFTRVMLQQAMEGAGGPEWQVTQDSLDALTESIMGGTKDINQVLDEMVAPAHPMGGPIGPWEGPAAPVGRPPADPEVEAFRAQRAWDDKKAALEQRKRLIIDKANKRGYTTSAEWQEFKDLKKQMAALGERPKAAAARAFSQQQALEERLIAEYDLLGQQAQEMRAAGRIQRYPDGKIVPADLEAKAVMDRMSAIEAQNPWQAAGKKPDWLMEGSDWADAANAGKGTPRNMHEAKAPWVARQKEISTEIQAAKEAGDTKAVADLARESRKVQKELDRITREFGAADAARRQVPAQVEDLPSFNDGIKLAEQRIKEGRADETLAHIRNRLQNPDALTPAEKAKLEGGLKRLEEHAATMDAVEKAVAPKPKASFAMNFAYGADKRAGIASENTFDAILAGERTSTTRWNATDIAKSDQLAIGDTIEFTTKGASSTAKVDDVLTILATPRTADTPAIFTVTSKATGEVRQLSPAEFFAEWSQREGWSEEKARAFFTNEAKKGRLEARQVVFSNAPKPTAPDMPSISLGGDGFNPMDEFKVGEPSARAVGGSDIMPHGPEAIDDYINRRFWQRQVDPKTGKAFASREAYAQHLLNLDAQQVAGGAKPKFLESTPAGAMDRARVLGIPEAGAADVDALADPAPILNGQHDEELVSRLDAQVKDPAAAPKAQRTARDARNWVQNKQKRVLAAVDAAGGDPIVEAAIAVQSQAENAGIERFLRYPTSDPTKTFKQLNKLTTVRNLAKLAEDQGSRIVWLQKSQGIVTDAQVAELLNQVATVSTPEGMRNFLGYYDKFMTYLKAWQLTTPGFHVRNMMGGIFNNYLAGVDMGSTARFMKAMQKFKAGELEGEEADIMKAIYENVGGGQYSHHEIGVAASVRPSKNPFSPRYGPLRASAAFGGDVEFRLRGSLLYDRLIKGKSLQEALDDVTRYHFDYSNLSNFETGVVKRVVPFYVWTRYNFPLQMEMMAQTPNKYRYYQQFKHSFENSADKGKPVPSFLTNEMFGVPLPMHMGGGQQFLTPDLPMTRTLGQALPDTENWDPKKLGTYPTLLDPYMSQTAVPIKLPIELALSRQFFKGIPIKDTGKTEGYIGTQGPMSPVANFAGGRTKTDYMLEQLMPVYGQARRLVPDEKKNKDRWITNALSYVGVPLRTNTKRDQQNELLRRQYLGR